MLKQNHFSLIFWRILIMSMKKNIVKAMRNYGEMLNCIGTL